MCQADIPPPERPHRSVPSDIRDTRKAAGDPRRPQVAIRKSGQVPRAGGQVPPPLPPNRTPMLIGMKWKSEPVTKTLWNRPSTNNEVLAAPKLKPAPALIPNLVVEGDGPTSGLALRLYTPPPPIR